MHVIAHSPAQLCFAVLVTMATLSEVSAQETPRPRLQIINGSEQAVDVYWLKNDSERVKTASAEPGADAIITTTLGHRFLIVGRDDHVEVPVTSLRWIQARRFMGAVPQTAPDIPVNQVVSPPEGQGIPRFYAKYLSADGYPIVASETVNDYALKEAAYLIRLMLAQRPDVRQAMIESGSRLCILGYNEYTTDLPEFAHFEDPNPADGLSAKDYWDARARGTGGSQTDPFCSCGEENLLCYDGDPYSTENILIHELAHSIHLRGMENVDPTFDGRLKQTYDKAMAQGLWKGKYPSVNHHEYFAEGVQSWFDNNRENDHDHNHVNTRAELIEYDPGLAAMCKEVFGDTELRYSKPQTRLRDHLEGYDPTTAPKFTWPERLANAKTVIRAKAQERDRRAQMEIAAAKTDAKTSTRTLQGWTLHISRKLEQDDAVALARSLELLDAQLQEIVRVVPAPAVAELRKVPLWFSPVYEGTGPKAEYHPGAQWLKDHGRDPAMEKAVEFTNIRIFEQETRRMPNFALHELAHAYHDRVLGNDHAEIQAAHARAKASGTYDDVERQDAEGKRHRDKAYAMTNPQEYFAETTEAYFSKNDFFPFDKQELEKHDPQMFEVLGRAWGVKITPAADRLP